MRRLFLIAAVSALAVARPELYKEKEDFQFSRSSSDDGTKAGFYGAQRGNMGGNYERAHNMDTLAQHQMGGLIKQVEGELGDGANTRTGSVYTAANSRGLYGSGRYDLSNLEGRNFQEGVTYDDSQSHSSLSSRNSGYKGQSYAASNSGGHSSSHSHNSRYHGYQAAGQSDQTLQSSNLQASNLQATKSLLGSNQYDYDRRATYNTGHHITAGVHDQKVYDQSNAALYSSGGYDSNSQARYIATPVRIIVTPGRRIAVPVASQNYDAALVSSYDHNAVNSDAEVLRTNDQQAIYKPSSEPKHYESSYSYRKEWEKHDTKPVSVSLAVPTVNPFPKTSELYEDNQAQVSDHRFDMNSLGSHTAHSSKAYNADVNSASSSQSQYQSNYNAQHQRSSSGANSNAYTHGAYNSGAAGGLTNQIDDSNTQPKSYQSSYSYHKSWERQGDPYVVKPASNAVYDGQTSQKLTDDLNNQGVYTSHQQGSRYHQSHQRYASSNDDCDENGHIRVARSYQVSQNQDVTPQQESQNIYQGQEDFGQQTQNGWQNYEDLGQQSQSQWDKIEDVGQQSQNKWDNLEDLGQQTQNFEIGGQQIQNKWDKLEDLGQQAQNQFDQQDVGQETQNTWDKLDLSQQSPTDQVQRPQETWTTGDGTDNLGQQPQDWNKETQTPDTPESLHTFNIFNQHKYHSELVSSQDEEIGKHQVNKDIQKVQQDTITGVGVDQETFENPFSQKEDLGQQTQDSWSNMEAFNTQNTNNANKSIWEQNSDNTQQVSVDADSEMNTAQTNEQNDFLYNHRGSSKPWYNDQSQDHAFNFDQQTQTHRTNYWNSGSEIHTQNSWKEQSTNENNTFIRQSSHSSSTSPLMSFWNKIDRIEKQLSEKNDSFHTQTAEGSYLEHIHNIGSTNTDFTQSSQHNQLASSVQNVSKQSKTEETKATESPKHKQVFMNQDKSQPIDVGRGDIGPEDSGLDEGSDNNDNKTPAEIASLSLHNEPSIISQLDNKTLNTNEYNIHQSSYQKQQTNEKEATYVNSELSVISLNQQKLIENQKLLGGANSSNNRTLKINDDSISKQDLDIIYGQRENKNFENVNDEIDVNREPNLAKENSENKLSNPTPRDKQKNVYLDQTPVEIIQQNMDQQFEGFGHRDGRYNQENAREIEQKDGNLKPKRVEQEFEHIGQQNLGQSEAFVEQSENFGQQSEDFGQQAEDLWKPSEQMENQFDFGQQNIGQQNLPENLKDFSENVYTFSKPHTYFEQETIFADQKHTDHQLEINSQSQNLEQQSQTAWSEKLDFNQQEQIIPEQVENIETQPDIESADNVQPGTQQKDEVVESPREATTDKPGFWKSVGTKFGSAKDKVFSWFKSS